MRGDGIGPEIMDAALRVLDAVKSRFHIEIEYTDVPAGDTALREYGNPLPPQSVKAFAESNACLKGPVGETIADINRKLRFDFDLYANLRPAKSYPGICPPALSPNVNITVVRENSEGFYRAIENEVQPGIWISTGVFTEKGARRIAEFTFRYAKMEDRTKAKQPRVTLATKANIFPKTQGMYLRVFQEVAQEYHEIGFEHCYADALCARLVRQPKDFDIIVSENLLADLLSDLAGQIAGGLGMTPGTNINYETRHAYFEPTHGSAPDIVGKHVANPIGQIRSASLMLRYLGMTYNDASLIDGAASIEVAIGKLLNSVDRSVLPVEVGGKADAAKVADTVASLIESV
jgi:isocitrate/isopropylmalate dehydrogenase